MKKINVIRVECANEGIQDLYETLAECINSGIDLNGIEGNFDNGIIGAVKANDCDGLVIVFEYEEYEILD